MKLYHIALMLLLAAPVAPAAQGQAPAPILFDQESLLRHRLTGEQEVSIPAGARPGMIGIPVRVTISAEGEVLSARVEPRENYSGVDPAPAIAAVRAWRFRPFLYRGVAVPTGGTVNIDYRPAGEWRDRNAPFPPIDYGQLTIRLVRSACFGTCPDYSVTIDGEGNVRFSTRDDSLPGAAAVHREFGLGRSGMLISGDHRSRIDRATLDALIERFRAAAFFGLKPEYFYGATDNPTYELTFTSGGRSFTVTDYIGRMAGMPSEVTALEDAVDEVAGTARWLRGGPGTLTALRAEEFDPGGPDGMTLALASTVWWSADEQLAIDLIEAGVPLDRSLPAGHPMAGPPLGEQMLLAAISHHRPRTVAALAERGWLARLPRQRLSNAFADGGGGCDPAIARQLVAAGADPMARTREGDEFSPRGRTALQIAVVSGEPCKDMDRRELVAALVALGVDINAVGETGQTALYGVEDPDLLDQMLTLGARADVHDREGNSPIFSSWTDRIVLGLLEAGADPRGHYYDGKTLRQQMRERDMPSVRAWLDAHRIR